MVILLFLVLLPTAMKYEIECLEYKEIEQKTESYA